MISVIGADVEQTVQHIASHGQPSKYNSAHGRLRCIAGLLCREFRCNAAVFLQLSEQSQRA